MQSKLWIFLKCKVFKQHDWTFFWDGDYCKRPYYVRQCGVCGTKQELAPTWDWKDTDAK